MRGGVVCGGGLTSLQRFTVVATVALGHDERNWGAGCDREAQCRVFLENGSSDIYELRQHCIACNCVTSINQRRFRCIDVESASTVHTKETGVLSFLAFRF
eukprot:m.272799 g.272799  ORF g.272799 m.272799 type:complete len:101 (+) comp40567_c0_seq101:826-1128(+)